MLGLTGLLLIGCGADQGFQDALAEKSITIGAGPADATKLGRTVCARHDAGAPIGQIVDEVRRATVLGPRDTGYVIGAATAAYCEQHLPRLRGTR